MPETDPSIPSESPYQTPPEMNAPLGVVMEAARVSPNITKQVDAGIASGISPRAAATMPPPVAPPPAVDPESLRKKAPLLSQVFISDPYVSAAAREHWAALSSAEAIATGVREAQQRYQEIKAYGKDAPNAFISGYENQELDTLYFDRYTGKPVDEGRISYLEGRKSESAYAHLTDDSGWVGKTLQGAATSVGVMASSAERSLDTAAAGAVVGSIVPLPGFSTMAGAGAGFKFGYFYDNIKAAAGANMHAWSQLRDAGGNKLDDNLMLALATVAGTAQAGIDVYSDMLGAKLVTGRVLKPLTGKLLSPAVLTKMMGDSAGASLLNRVARMGSAAAVEGVAEGSQEFIGMVGEWALKNLSQLTNDNVFTPQEATLLQNGGMDQIIQAAKDGFSVGLLFAGTGAVAEAGVESLFRKADASQTIRTLDEQRKVVDIVATAAHDAPNLTGALMQKTMPAIGNANFHPENLATFTPDILLRVGFTPAHLERAKAEGRLLSVNLAVVAKLEPDLRQQFTDLFVDPVTGMTTEQAKAAEADADEETKEAVKKVSAEQSAMREAEMDLRLAVQSSLTKEAKTRLAAQGISPKKLAEIWVNHLKNQAKYLVGDRPMMVTKYLQDRTVGFQKAPEAGVKALYLEKDPGGKHRFLLTEHADASSLFHEAAHAFKSDFKDMADAARATAAKEFDPAALKMPVDEKNKIRKRTEAEQKAFEDAQDIQDARRLVGDYDALVQRLPSDPVKAQETFARWMEKALRSGEIPNEKMADVYRKIRTFMTAVYRDRQQVADEYRAQFGEELPSDETLDSVFESIIAGDRYVREAAAAVPFPEAFEKLGLTESEAKRLAETRDEYIDAYEKKIRAAMSALHDRVSKENIAAATAAADSVAMKQVWAIQELKKQGVPDDVIAQKFGITPIDVMNAERELPREKWIKRVASKRTRTLLPKNRRAQMMGSAVEGAMNTMDSVYRRLLGKKKLGWSHLQSRARLDLRSIASADALNIREHTSNMERALREHSRALAKGNVLEAHGKLMVAEVHRQRIMEAGRILDEMRKSRVEIAKAMRAEPGTYGQAPHDALITLGRRLGIGADKSGTPTFQVHLPIVTGTIAVNDVIPVSARQFAENISNPSYGPLPIAKMSVENLYEALNAAKALMHVGKQLMEDKGQAYKESLAPLREEAEALAKRYSGGKRTDTMKALAKSNGVTKMVVEKLGKWSQPLVHSALAFESSVFGLRYFAHAIEGGNATGSAQPTTKVGKLLDSATQAVQDRNKRLESWVRQLPLKSIRDSIGRLDRLLADPNIQAQMPRKPEGYHIAGRGEWTGSDVLTIAAHMASYTGREMAANAFGWKVVEHGIPAEASPILRLVTEEDAKVLESVAHLLDQSVFPPANDVFEQKNGYKQAKIETEKYDTPNGVRVDGMYFPGHMDLSIAVDGSKLAPDEEFNSRYNDPEQAAAMAAWNPQQARHDALHERSGKSGYGLKTDFVGVLYSHMKWMAHWVEVEPIMADAQAVVADARNANNVRESIGQLLGVEGRNALEASIAAVRHPMPDPAKIVASRWLLTLTGNVAKALLSRSLAGPVKSAAQNVPSVIKAGGLKNYGEGIRLFFNKEMRENFRNSELVKESLHFSDKRATTMLNDMAHGKSTEYRQWTERAMALWVASDYASLYPAWAGAYADAKKNGASNAQAEKTADDLIRPLIPKMLETEQGEMARKAGTMGSILMVFTAWARKLYQRDKAVFNAFNNRKIGLGEFVAHHAMNYFFPAAILSLSYAAITKEKEDAGDIAAAIASQAAGQYLSWMPYVGPAAGAAIASMLGGTSFGASRVLPIDVPFATYKEVVKDIESGKISEATWDTLRFASLISGIPALEILETARKRVEAAKKSGVEGMLLGDHK